MIGGYLLMSLSFAAIAVLSAHNRVFNAIFAVTWVINAVVYFQGKLPLRFSGLRDGQAK